ncbi:hypothetical protein KQX54_020326 [Cotesia glomerata]|uniref:Uncharacterized protein n=1 Tax=Cotesia glomerata TaxID=32391 RepID=A0AAV7I368_COTGL|nr:hypothetical protein KQX54_020326 [Cotesia glomerata]
MRSIFADLLYREVDSDSDLLWLVGDRAQSDLHPSEEKFSDHRLKLSVSEIYHVWIVGRQTALDRRNVTENPEVCGAKKVRGVAGVLQARSNACASAS